MSIPCIPLLLLLSLSIGTTWAASAGLPDSESMVEKLDNNERRGENIDSTIEIEKKFGLNLVVGVVEQLKQNIWREWKRIEQEAGVQQIPKDQDEINGSLAVVALNEVRKFRLYLEGRQKLRAERAKSGEANNKNKQLGFFRSIGKHIQEYVNEGSEEPINGEFNLDDFLNSPPSRPPLAKDKAQEEEDDDDDDNNSDIFNVREPGPAKETTRRSTAPEDEDARQLERARTYADYVDYVKKHNADLRSEKLESIRHRTVEFVKTLFVSEVKELAFELLFWLMASKTGPTTSAMDPKTKTKLIWDLQQKFIVYLTGVLADLVALIVGQKSSDTWRDVVYSK